MSDKIFVWYFNKVDYSISIHENEEKSYITPLAICFVHFRVIYLDPLFIYLLSFGLEVLKNDSHARTINSSKEKRRGKVNNWSRLCFPAGGKIVRKFGKL